MPRARGIALLFAVASCASVSAHADGPAFDRPGIAFAPGTLPAHSWAWEQGLPDFQRDRADGVTSTGYAATTRLRYGITDRLEVQGAVPLLQEIDSPSSGRAFTESGTGDISLAAKYSIISGDGPLDLAALATVSFPTASKRELGNDSAQYSLGATLGRSLGDTQAIAFYVNVDVLDGDVTWTLSPNWSFALTSTLGGYVEAGFQPATHGESANDTAGGGLTWMVRRTVQLDAYVLSGLTKASTDVAAGCGVSVYFP